MTRGGRRTLLGLAVLGPLWLQGAAAAIVTVPVTTPAGTAAEDTVVLFDPLDATPPPASGKATIDQLNKRFRPLVSVIRTGTVVLLPNSDSIRHEVYSHSPPHPFKIKLYASDHQEQVLFDKPGLLILGCNIHDTMVAFVVVSDSPYFAKILASGSATFNLPPGRYRLRVWHPKLRTSIEPREISVGAAALTLPLTVDLDPARMTAPALPE